MKSLVADVGGEGAGARGGHEAVPADTSIVDT